MDLGSILGVVIAVVAILLGNALEGGHIGALVQPTAFMIVTGGTIGATMLGFPLPVFIKAMKSLRYVFAAHAEDKREIVEEIVSLGHRARREGVVALEQPAQSIRDPFLRKALMMAVDGTDSKSMRESLELVINHFEDDRAKIPKVWESAGGYAPTIGIIGAVMGLIHVMQNLSDVSKVGKGIAVAFVATIYGVSLANLLLLPVAYKLKLRLKAETKRLELIMEGVLAIQEGLNPAVIRERLEGFFLSDS
jgi:chemotaxis protein MotA